MKKPLRSVKGELSARRPVMSGILCLMISVVLVISAASCSQQPQGIGELIWLTDPDNPDVRRVQCQLDTNLTADAAVKGPIDIEGACVYRAAMLMAEREALVRSVLRNRTIVERTESDSAASYRAEDGAVLEIQGAAVNFYTPRSEAVSLASGIEYSFEQGTVSGNTDVYAKNGNLPFMGRSEAVEAVRQELAAFGIPVYEQAEVYALDYQTLQEQEEIRAREGLTAGPAGKATLKEVWDEEDNCYFMLMNVSVEGFPVFAGMNAYEEDSALLPGSTLMVCYSAQGMESLLVHAPYRQTGIEQESRPVMSLEDLMRHLRETYQGKELSQPVAVTEISLSYVPVLGSGSETEVLMKPAWCCVIAQDIKADDGTVMGAMEIEMIIDAVTGEELT